MINDGNCKSAISMERTKRIVGYSGASENSKGRRTVVRDVIVFGRRNGSVTKSRPTRIYANKTRAPISDRVRQSRATVVDRTQHSERFINVFSEQLAYICVYKRARNNNIVVVCLL